MRPKNFKVLKYFLHRDFATEQLVKYAHVVVKDEVVDVRSVKIRQDNVYDVPANKIEDRTAYVEPLLDPNYNVRRSFRTYRKLVGFIQPRIIKQFCKVHRISQRELSDVLGIGVAIVSEFENEHLIQKVSQDTLLRCVMDYPLWSSLRRTHLPISKIRRSDYRDYHAYKEAVNKTGNLVKPQAVRSVRQRLGLSIYEVCAVLGFSVSALSKVENGKLIPSVSQDTRLRCLLDPHMFACLLKSHILTIERAPFAKTQHVKVAHLKQVWRNLVSGE